MKSMPFEAGEAKRVILHIDVDSFEFQVWIKRCFNSTTQKFYESHPTVVVNPDNVILSVNYPAKNMGITRDSRVKQLPRIVNIVKARTKRGGLDTDHPLQESNRILQVLKEEIDDIILERASRDEVYIDLTKEVSFLMRKQVQGFNFSIKQKALFLAALVKGNFIAALKTSVKDLVLHAGSFELINEILSVYGNPELDQMEKSVDVYHLNNIKLLCGALLGNTLLKNILTATGYRVSIGIGHSKLTAKLACGKNKPEGIAIFAESPSQSAVNLSIPFQEVPNYRGATGKKIQDAGRNLKTLGDIKRLGMKGLEDLFHSIDVSDPRTRAEDLLKICNFQDDEPVKPRYYSHTLNHSMSFTGRHCARDLQQFYRRVINLSRNFEEKLEYRSATHGVVGRNFSVKVELKNAENFYHQIYHTQWETAITNHRLIFDFIKEFIEANAIKFKMVEKISLKSSNFQ